MVAARYTASRPRFHTSPVQRKLEPRSSLHHDIMTITTITVIIIIIIVIKIIIIIIITIIIILSSPLGVQEGQAEGVHDAGAMLGLLLAEQRRNHGRVLG
jgi:hypothetical protein